MKRLLLASTAFLLPLAAQASVFVPGSLFSVEAVNSPGDTPAGGAVVSLVDFVNQVIVTSGGAVNLRVTETPDGTPGGEWIGFEYTVNFGSIAGNPAANWSLNEVGLQTGVASNFVGSFISFDSNSTSGPNGPNSNLPPTACNIFGGNFSVGSDPTGQTGTGCLAQGFSDPFAQGVLPALGSFINPFSFISAAGIDPAEVGSYFQALDFRPQQETGVPEPSALAVLGLGLLGLFGAERWRRG